VVDGTLFDLDLFEPLDPVKAPHKTQHVVMFSEIDRANGDPEVLGYDRMSSLVIGTGEILFGLRGFFSSLRNMCT
jgi:hypothetical protein